MIPALGSILMVKSFPGHQRLPIARTLYRNRKVIILDDFYLIDSQSRDRIIRDIGIAGVDRTVPNTRIQTLDSLTGVYA